MSLADDIALFRKRRKNGIDVLCRCDLVVQEVLRRRSDETAQTTIACLKSICSEIQRECREDERRIYELVRQELDRWVWYREGTSVNLRLHGISGAKRFEVKIDDEALRFLPHPTISRQWLDVVDFWAEHSKDVDAARKFAEQRRSFVVKKCCKEMLEQIAGQFKAVASARVEWGQHLASCKLPKIVMCPFCSDLNERRFTLDELLMHVCAGHAPKKAETRLDLSRGSVAPTHIGSPSPGSSPKKTSGDDENVSAQSPRHIRDARQESGSRGVREISVDSPHIQRREKCWLCGEQATLGAGVCFNCNTK